MRLRSLAILLLAGVALAQESAENPNDQIRRLRFRRPRPKVVGVSNEEGVQQGRPIPLAAIPTRNQEEQTAQLLAAALTDQAADPLETLLATAARTPDVPQAQEPIAPRQQARPQQRPQPRPVQAAPASSGRTREPPGVPRRRPRPRAEDGEERGSRLPSRPQADPVKTTERYSHKNEDGSFTFGYIAEDGSFREETRGVDCITRGKYGYIDPDGKRREFTYVSGLPCEIGEEGEIDEDEEAIEDPIDPSDRFRTSQAVQLNDDEIPDSARPRARQPARPPVDNASRPRDPALANRRPRPQANANVDTRGGALGNLLAVAEGAAAGRRPAAGSRRPVARPNVRPTRPSATTTGGAFNFDSELDSFTLNKPALTFAQERPKSAQGAPAAAPTPVGPSFSSELVFNPATGTFQTELRQGVAGGSGEIRLSNAAAPSGRKQPTSAPATPRPAARPPTPTAVRTSFSPTPRPARPTPFTAFNTTPRPTAGAAPGGQIQFEGLSFPDPSSVQTPAPRPPTPSPTPSRPAAPPTTPSRPPPPPRPAPTQPANSIFFQSQPQPQRPPTPAARPATQTVLPAGTFTLGAPATAQRPAQPVTLGARPPAPAAQPVRTQPQVQFGFQPVQQARPQTQGTPFTAFNGGVPQQLRGVPAPQQFRPQQPQQFRPQQPQQFRQQPQQFRPQPQTTFGRPPTQFGGQPQQLGIPPQLQGARFQPQARPPPQQQSSPFTVFNPAQFRG